MHLIAIPEATAGTGGDVHKQEYVSQNRITRNDPWNRIQKSIWIQQNQVPCFLEIHGLIKYIMRAFKKS